LVSEIEFSALGVNYATTRNWKTVTELYNLTISVNA
jgi:hypothetical protein